MKEKDVATENGDIVREERRRAKKKKKERSSKFPRMLSFRGKAVQRDEGGSAAQDPRLGYSEKTGGKPHRHSIAATPIAESPRIGSLDLAGGRETTAAKGKSLPSERLRRAASDEHVTPRTPRSSSPSSRTPPSRGGTSSRGESPTDFGVTVDVVKAIRGSRKAEHGGAGQLRGFTDSPMDELAGKPGRPSIPVTGAKGARRCKTPVDDLTEAKRRATIAAELSPATNGNSDRRTAMAKSVSVASLQGDVWGNRRSGRLAQSASMGTSTNASVGNASFLAAVNTEGMTKREIAAAKRAFRKSMNAAQSTQGAGQPGGHGGQDAALRLRVQQLEVKNRVLGDEFNRTKRLLQDYRAEILSKREHQIRLGVLRPRQLPMDMGRLATPTGLAKNTTLFQFLEETSAGQFRVSTGAKAVHSARRVPSSDTSDAEMTISQTSSLEVSAGVQADFDKIDPREVVLKCELSRGGSARIFVGTWRSQDVCVKVLRSQVQSDKYAEDLRKEYGLLSQVKSPYNVIVHGFCTVPCFCMVTEFCERGSLHYVMTSKENDAAFKTWDIPLKLAMDLLRGIRCLHEWKPQIVHRDIKAGNLLVDARWNLKIGDFGLSRFVTDEAMRGTLKDVRSTLTHCSPEVWKGEHWSAASDMYSVAIVLWEVVSRVLKGKFVQLFADNKKLRTDFQVLLHAIEGNRPEGMEVNARIKGLELLENLISGGWDGVPENRPTFEKAVEMMERIHDDYLENWQMWEEVLPHNRTV